MYSVEGLEHGIERCRHNIKVLEDAADAERKTIADYRKMIHDIEVADKTKVDMEKKVVRDGVSD